MLAISGGVRFEPLRRTDNVEGETCQVMYVTVALRKRSHYGERFFGSLRCFCVVFMIIVESTWKVATRATSSGWHPHRLTLAIAGGVRFEPLRRPDSPEGESTNDDISLSHSHSSGSMYPTSLVPDEITMAAVEYSGKVCICPICEEEFTSFMKLTDHVAVDHQSSEFSCDQGDCSRRFRTRQALTSHVRHVHKGLVKSTPKSASTNAAGGPMTTWERLEAEAKRKAETPPTKPFEERIQERVESCPYQGCGESFRTRKGVLDHVESFHGGASFTCPFEHCGAEYEYRESLRRHVKDTHMRGEFANPHFPCTVDGCSKVYRREQSLHHHVSTVHNGQVFKCDSPGCSKEYRFRGSLRRHKLDHHVGELPMVKQLMQSNS